MTIRIQSINYSQLTIDELVKSRNMHNFVIPVKTGIQCFQIVVCFWIPAYAGMTDFLRVHQFVICKYFLTEFHIPSRRNKLRPVYSLLPTPYCLLRIIYAKKYKSTGSYDIPNYIITL